jgi:hypothetical protein
MGLLDDAIREHLDLKRRRGADPAEIERAEREALGPVRRGPEEAEPDDLTDSPEAYDRQSEEDWGEAFEDAAEPELPEFLAERPQPVIFDDEHERMADDEDVEPPADAAESPEWDEPSGAAEPSRAEEPATRYDDLAAEQAGEADRGEPAPDLGAPRPEPATREPEPPPPASSSRRSPQVPPVDPTVGETAEYDVEDALRHERGTSEDDVLEETPEFLQDTPDHDRLWFEQRPPKDFDFDG